MGNGFNRLFLQTKMANKYMNRCAINHYGNANQNQMRYHFTTLRMPKIKTDSKKCDEDVEKLKPSHEASGNVEWHSCFGNQFHSSAKYST